MLCILAFARWCSLFSCSPINVFHNHFHNHFTVNCAIFDFPLPLHHTIGLFVLDPENMGITVWFSSLSGLQAEIKFFDIHFQSMTPYFFSFHTSFCITQYLCKACTAFLNCKLKNENIWLTSWVFALWGSMFSYHPTNVFSSKLHYLRFPTLQITQFMYQYHHCLLHTVFKDYLNSKVLGQVLWTNTTCQVLTLTSVNLVWSSLASLAGITLLIILHLLLLQPFVKTIY